MFFLVVVLSCFCFVLFVVYFVVLVCLVVYFVILVWLVVYFVILVCLGGREVSNISSFSSSVNVNVLLHTNNLPILY